MDESFPRIPGITCDFPRPDGFARPDWGKIMEWVDSQEPESVRPSLFAAIEAEWAEDLGASISADYNSYVADHVILVSSQFERDAIATVSFCERVHAWLESVIGKWTSELSGRHVVVLFDDPDEYWEYGAWFHSEGEFGASAGMTIFSGVVHVVVAPGGDGAMEQLVISHEMVHSFLSGRGLPQWLEEGLAQRSEQYFFPTYKPDPDREDFERIAKSFDEETMPRFWRGESFGVPRDEEEQKAAYSLALVLCNVLLHDHSNVRAFFENARWEDAGEGAAQEHLAVSLGELVARILGPGEWAPKPEEWPGWDGEAAAAY
jgi:hypothetical protein